ncbi:nad-binding protein [Diplodia corticola]|uniref:Nad-binding protein n=1 Tax=Diplodia corticola TaxID=236234 RepID=A0A1J9S4Z4_9PEZI|nr:nad-binding protein [Diplodia corticola]OJD35020.1 nad-binding protein [Diplodia corticola]
MAAEAPADPTIPPSATHAPPPQPPQPPPHPEKAHILVTGASSGLGRAFFEHFSSFPPGTHHVRGIDARPYPTHPAASSCFVGACGTFNQVDLTAEALVRKFVQNATIPGAAAAAQSRSHSRSTSSSAPLASPTVLFRDRQHSYSRWPDTPDTGDLQSSPSTTPAQSPSTLVPPSAPPTTKEARKDSTAQHPPRDGGDPPAAAAPYAGPFTLVIHSAGTRGLVPSHEAARPHDVAGAESIGAMDAATMRRTYEINTVAAFVLIKALLPSLLLSSPSSSAAASSASSSSSTSTISTTSTSPAAPAPANKPKFVLMASRMGSIGSNGSNNSSASNSNALGGGGYAYRASKAALNAVVRSFSVDVPDVVFALVHPGRVETNLVKTKEEGAVDVGESVADVLRLIDRLGAAGEDGLPSGCFVDRWGETIPW